MKHLCGAVLALTLLIATATAAYNPKWARDALYASRVSNCDGARMANWTCGSSCDYFPGMSNVHVFSNASGGTRGWIGYDKQENRVMLTIRGSRNLKNWIEDFEFWQVDYPHCQGCKVEHGFLAAYYNLADTGMMTAFINLVHQYPDSAVLVNGHSLGASMATIAMAELLRTEAGALKNRTVELYTFGSPRVGNPTFVSYVGSLLPHMREHRLTHSADPIPHLPPRSWGYLQVPQEVFLPKNASTPYKLCNGNFTAEDPTCHDSEPLFPLKPFDHIWYLGECMGCCGPAPYDNCCKHLPTMTPPEVMQQLEGDYFFF